MLGGKPTRSQVAGDRELHVLLSPSLLVLPSTACLSVYLAPFLDV